MNEIKPCPHCGHSAKVSWKDCAFGGENGMGSKKTKYRFVVICKKCHSRGKPIISDWLIDCNPWASWYNSSTAPYRCDKQTAMIEPYVKLAIEAWNTRYV